MMRKCVFLPLLASVFMLGGCNRTSLDDNKEYKSFKEVAGLETSNITGINVSEGVAFSFAWNYQFQDYSFVDTMYEKVEYSIYDEIYQKDRADGGDAICLRFSTDITLETYPVQAYTFMMYISYADQCLYYGSSIQGANEAYRSKDKVSDSVVSKLLDKTNQAQKHHLNVIQDSSLSLDTPESGDYQENYRFSFKTEIVTDLTTYVFLNDELLPSIRSDDTLGGYTYYEFMMPKQDSTLVITNNKFYVNKYYSFAEVFPWVNELNKYNLKGVRIEDGTLGTDPSKVKSNIRYSEDERDIAYNLSVLKNEPLVKVVASQDVEGGSYRIVTYVVSETQWHQIIIENGLVIYQDFSSSQRFRFDSTPTNMPDVFYPISD